jgi:hypothetical protein
MPMLRRANLYDVELEHDSEPEGYGASDKIGVFPPNPDDRAMLRREDGQRDYWAGAVEPRGGYGARDRSARRSSIVSASATRLSGR